MPTIEEVDNYPLPELLIPRIAKLYHHTEEIAADLVKEAKRMLYLRAVTGNPVSPSEEIDDAWHEMILFTKFYQQFADFIGHFVHHNPTPGPPDGGKMYANTKKMYEEVFGEKPNHDYWTD